MQFFPYYRQLNQMDCGPTCLRMIAKHYGKKISIERLRKEGEINKEGVNLLGISQSAEKIGFKTRGVKVTFEQLVTNTPKPIILHWSQKHFVVLITVKKMLFRRADRIVIADPAKEIISYSKEEFLNFWATTTDGSEPIGVALLLEPTTDFYKQEEEFDTKVGWGMLFGYLQQQKKYIFQLFIGLLVGSLMQLIYPFLTQSIVDIGINTHNLQFIYIILIAQFMLFFGRTTIDFIRTRILLHISTKLNVSILSDFWIKLMKLPISYFDSKMTGDIIQRIGDHQRIQSFLTGSALSTFFSLFNLIIFSFVLLQYNVQIFFIFFGASTLYFFWVRLFLAYRRKLDYKRFGLASKENTLTMQLIQGMQEIKLNNAELLKRWDWENLQAGLFKLSFKSLSLSQYQQAGAFFINEGKNILISFLVAKSVLEGQLTLGSMLAVQYIIGQLNSPIEQLIGFVQQAQDAKISLERLNEIHQIPEEEPINKDFIRQLPSDKTILFNNLSFTYPGAGNEPVLRKVNLRIAEGKVTAIVGMSGSGKTTMLKLLLKFYDNYKGEIKVGDSNLNYISPSYWRSRCGNVMQEGFIFNDTIANNITVCDEQPLQLQLLHACKVANILSFIESLPLGFNTKIGIEGNGISQGQKQRLLIARAVYKNPDYLFFDEATNALDANNEKIIMQNLHEFFKGKTVVIVAHRLSTVKNADNIILLHEGEVVEEGSHDTLSKHKGRYYELVKNQLELGN